MLWENRGSFSATSNGMSLFLNSLGFVPMQSNDIALIGVGIDTAAATASLSAVNGTASFLTFFSLDHASRAFHFFLGYNLAGVTTVRVDTDQSGFSGFLRMLSTDRDWSGGAPAYSVNTVATGTSAAAETNTMTPAAGDLLMALMMMPSNTADSTARTHTGNTYINPTAAEHSVNFAQRIEMGFAANALAVSSKENWTLASSQDWAAIQVTLTPPATLLSPVAALLVKGLTTAAADAASSF